MFELNSFQFVDGYIASLWLSVLMRFLAAGFCVPVVPESGILVGMYEIHEEVLCPEGIYPHGDTGYPVCNSCKEYAGGHPARLGL